MHRVAPTWPKRGVSTLFISPEPGLESRPPVGRAYPEPGDAIHLPINSFLPEVVCGRFFGHAELMDRVGISYQNASMTTPRPRPSPKS